MNQLDLFDKQLNNLQRGVDAAQTELRRSEERLKMLEELAAKYRENHFIFADFDETFSKNMSNNEWLDFYNGKEEAIADARKESNRFRIYDLNGREVYWENFTRSSEDEDCAECHGAGFLDSDELESGQSCPHC